MMINKAEIKIIVRNHFWLPQVINTTQYATSILHKLKNKKTKIAIG